MTNLDPAHKLLLVVNPHARSSRLNPKAHNRLSKILGEAGKVELTPSLEALDTLMEREAQRAASGNALPGRTLCFHGGDGSISRGITSFVRHFLRAKGEEPAELPPILVVRAGTFNMLCNRLGISASVFSSVKHWKEGRHTRLLRIPTMKVSVDGFEPTYGFVFGWGIGFRVLRQYYSMRAYPGVFDGSVIAAKTIMSALHPGASNKPLFAGEDTGLKVNGDYVLPDTPVRAIMAGTIERLCLGFRPMPLTVPREGTFHIAVTGLPLWKLAVLSPSFLWGFFREQSSRPYASTYHGADVQHADFHGSEGFTVDGEVFTYDGSRRIVIQPGPIAQFWVDKSTVV